MSQYFYNGIKDDDSVVIYPFEQNESIITSDFKIIDGFMESGEIVINQLKKQNKKLDGLHYNLIYPLLNLYCCIIEFSLKASIRFLIEHKNDCNCPFLIVAPKKINKILNSHNIKELIQVFIQIINNTYHHPHCFDELTLLLIIGEEFEKYGINCMSTRYHYKKIKKENSSERYKLYKKRKNVRLYKLHNDIRKVAGSLYTYIDNARFTLCPMYSARGRKKLEEISALTIKNEHLFRSLYNGKKTKKKGLNSKEIVLPSDIINEICNPPSKTNKEFYNNIQSLPNQEKNAILKCLLLGSRAFETIDLSFDYPDDV